MRRCGTLEGTHPLIEGRLDPVPATPRAVELAVTAATAAADKLADDVLAFDVSDQMVITDVFVLASAPNDRQVRAIVDEIEDKMRLAGAKPVRREGEREGRWVLLDYSDVIVHVMHAEDRVFYALERLWKDCPLVELPEEVNRARTVHDDPTRGTGFGMAGGSAR